MILTPTPETLVHLRRDRVQQHDAAGLVEGVAEQRRRDRGVLVAVEQEVKELGRRLLLHRLLARLVAQREEHRVQRLGAVAVLLGAVADPLGDEARRVDLAIMEVGDLCPQQVVLELRVARVEHVADQQRAADDSLGRGDRRDGDAGHAVGEGPDVLGRLALERGADGRVLGAQVLAVHRVDVQVAGDDLADRVDDGDDVGLARAGRQVGVQPLALLEGGLALGGLVGLVEDADHAGPVGQTRDQVGEVERLEARNRLVHPLRPRDVGFDLMNHRFLEVLGDNRMHAQGKDQQDGGSDKPDLHAVHVLAPLLGRWGEEVNETDLATKRRPDYRQRLGKSTFCRRSGENDAKS